MNAKIAQNPQRGSTESYGNYDHNPLESEEEMQTLFTSNAVRRNNASLSRLLSGSHSTTFAPTMNPTQMASFSARRNRQDQARLVAGAYGHGVGDSRESHEPQRPWRQGSHLQPKSSPSLGPDSPSPHYGTMRRVSRNEDCDVLNYTAYTG